MGSYRQAPFSVETVYRQYCAFRRSIAAHKLMDAKYWEAYQDQYYTMMVDVPEHDRWMWMPLLID
jgi:hypothetical protein